MNNIGISYIFHLCITPNHFLIPTIYSGVFRLFSICLIVLVFAVKSIIIISYQRLFQQFKHFYNRDVGILKE